MLFMLIFAIMLVSVNLVTSLRNNTILRRKYVADEPVINVNDELAIFGVTPATPDADNLTPSGPGARLMSQDAISVSLAAMILNAGISQNNVHRLSLNAALEQQAILLGNPPTENCPLPTPLNSLAKQQQQLQQNPLSLTALQKELLSHRISTSSPIMHLIPPSPDTLPMSLATLLPSLQSQVFNPSMTMLSRELQAQQLLANPLSHMPTSSVNGKQLAGIDILTANLLVAACGLNVETAGNHVQPKPTKSLQDEASRPRSTKLLVDFKPKSYSEENSED